MRKRYGVGGYSIDGNDAWASLEPRCFKEDHTTTGVIYGHGHAALDHPALVLHYNLLFLGDAGHAIAGAENPRQVFMGDFQNNAWGNNAAAFTTAEGFNFLSGYLGADEDGVFLMGGSMGFLTVCNFTRWVQGAFEISGATPPEVEIKGIVGLVPAVDMDDIRARNYGGYASEIVSAYGGTTAYNAALPTHNPINYASDLNVPVAIWYSEDDPATLAGSVETFGEAAQAEMHNLGNVGHTYYGIDFDELTEFFDRHE